MHGTTRNKGRFGGGMATASSPTVQDTSSSARKQTARSRVRSRIWIPLACALGVLRGPDRRPQRDRRLATTLLQQSVRLFEQRFEQRKAVNWYGTTRVHAVLAWGRLAPGTLSCRIRPFTIRRWILRYLLQKAAIGSPLPLGAEIGETPPFQNPDSRFQSRTPSPPSQTSTRSVPPSH